MGFLPVDALHAACKRYGPGRLPRAENHAIGAGYAGATAAVCTAAVYAGTATVVDSLGLEATAEFATVVLAGLALPFVVPAAFAIGLVGWNVFPLRSPVGGAIAGFLGTIGTYALALLLFGALVTTLEALSGADPLRAAVFSWGVVYFAFVETWWAALPTGSISGLVYGTVVSQTE